MTGFRLRGVQVNGEDYAHWDDLRLLLAAYGEIPNLNDSQRRVIDAILKDMREAKVTVAEENWDGEEV